MQDVPNEHPSLDELTAFDRGQLRPGKREVLEQHIARCATCCQRLDCIADDQLVMLLRTSASLTTSTVEMAVSTSSADTPPAIQGPAAVVLPSELVDHPRYRVLSPLGAGGM